MKKTLLALLFIAFIIPGLASAKTSAGIRPGSFAYFLDRGIEEFTLFFVINDEQRLEKEMRMIMERQAELGVTDDVYADPTEKPFYPEEEGISDYVIKPMSDDLKPIYIEDFNPTVTIKPVVEESKPVVEVPVKPDYVYEKPVTTKPIESKPVVTEKPSTDLTPRINYWWGKVNQHMDIKTGLWQTDPDGVSGANLDMLKYCQKWYPKTKSVKEYKFETIKDWKNRGNLLSFESKRMSYECSEKSTTSPVSIKPVETVPVIVEPVAADDEKEESSDGGKEDEGKQIMYWWGKVNRHLDDGEWVSDPNGSSGANVDMLLYCKKWYPNSVSVKENKLVTTDGWHDAGNVGEYTSVKMSYYCLQK